MQGSLTTTSPAELCLRLAEQETTGAVRLTGPRGRATLYLDRGRLVDVRTPDARHATGRRIGDRLVTAGKLARADLEGVLAEQGAMPDRAVLGQLLVDRGLVGADHVRLAVLDQLVEGLVELLEWNAGDFDVTVEETAPDAGVPVAVAMEHALTEAHRRIAIHDRIDRLVPDPAVTVLRPRPADTPPLEPDEAAVLSLVDGHRTAASIADELAISPDEAARLLYRLSLQGLVEAADEHRGTPHPSEEADTVTPAPAGNTTVALEDQGWAERRIAAPLVDEPEPWVGWAHGAPEAEDDTPPAAAGWEALARHDVTTPSPAPAAPDPAERPTRHAAADEPAAAAAEPAAPSPAPDRSLDNDTRQALFSELHQVSRKAAAPTGEPVLTPPPEPEEPSSADEPEPATAEAPEPSSIPQPPTTPAPRSADDADVSELLRELHALSLDED